MGRIAYKRTAYVSGGWAIIPDEVDPGILRRVLTRTMFFDCPVCGQLAGHRCKNKGNFVTWCHGDRGYGQPVGEEDRLAMSAGLIGADRFDEIHLLDIRTILRKKAKR